MTGKNKKGMEKMISIYWFAILALTAGAVVYMVLIFYGNPYDVRGLESDIMMNNVADCILENGHLKYELNNELKNGFLNICHINLETEEPEGQYYLEIEFFEKGFRISEGNPNLKNNSNKNSVFSGSKSFYSLDKNSNEVTVKMNVYINKVNKNAG